MKTLMRLILDDLERAGSPQAGHVASEESIRLIIEHYNQAFDFNGVYVHINDLDHFFHTIIEQYSGAGTVRYNVVLQTGERSKSDPKSHYSAHYAAIVLEINEEAAKIAFADHYRKIPAYPTLERCIAEYNLLSYRFYGEPLQRDRVHCYIYTLEHLVQLNAYQDLFSMVPSVADDSGNIHWREAPIELQWSAQSFTYLWRVVDELDPSYLSKTHGVREEDFSSIVSANFYVDASGKARNGAICGIASEHAQGLYHAIDSGQYILDQMLDVYYKEAHPTIYNLIDKIRALNLPSGDSHPIYEFVFNNIYQMEACLLDRKIAAIFSHEAIGRLAEAGKISYEVIAQCIANNYGAQSDANALEVNKEQVNVLYNNRSIYAKLLELNLDNMTDVLLHKNAKKILQNNQLFALIQSGDLDIHDALSLVSYRIDFGLFKEKMPAEQVGYLRRHLSKGDSSDSASPSPLMERNSNLGVMRLFDSSG